uniref:Uncharacterized protein n=1 Tax=Rhizophagus irregularis (strain DAOM 181602 / DAOM 197198 / MUCL 43194) TaxID=747089 RepID=U9U9F8_RHIID
MILQLNIDTKIENCYSKFMKEHDDNLSGIITNSRTGRKFYKKHFLILVSCYNIFY